VRVLPKQPFLFIFTDTAYARTNPESSLLLPNTEPTRYRLTTSRPIIRNKHWSLIQRKKQGTKWSTGRKSADGQSSIEVAERRAFILIYSLSYKVRVR